MCPGQAPPFRHGFASTGSAEMKRDPERLPCRAVVRRAFGERSAKRSTQREVGAHSTTPAGPVLSPGRKASGRRQPPILQTAPRQWSAAHPGQIRRLAMPPQLPSSTSADVCPGLLRLAPALPHPQNRRAQHCEACTGKWKAPPSRDLLPRTSTPGRTVEKPGPWDSLARLSGKDSTPRIRGHGPAGRRAPQDWADFALRTSSSHSLPRSATDWNTAVAVR